MDSFIQVIVTTSSDVGCIKSICAQMQPLYIYVTIEIGSSIYDMTDPTNIHTCIHSPMHCGNTQNDHHYMHSLARCTYMCDQRICNNLDCTIVHAWLDIIGAVHYKSFVHLLSVCMYACTHSYIHMTLHASSYFH